MCTADGWSCCQQMGGDVASKWVAMLSTDGWRCCQQMGGDVASRWVAMLSTDGWRCCQQMGGDVVNRWVAMLPANGWRCCLFCSRASFLQNITSTCIICKILHRADVAFDYGAVHFCTQFFQFAQGAN